MEAIERTAETIEQAIAEGLQELGANANEVMIEVLEEPSRGIFGIGARPAKVRIMFMGKRPAPPPPPPAPVPQKPAVSERANTRNDSKPARSGDRPQQERRNDRNSNRRGGDASRRGGNSSRGGGDDFNVAYDDPEDLELTPSTPIIADEDADEVAREAKTLLLELLQAMTLEEVTVTIHRAEATRPQEEAHWVLNIAGKNVKVLVGRRGDTLASLQYILRLMLSRKLQRRVNVIVDVAEYKLRRSERLRELANRMADQALQQGRAVTLEPMPANERRIIHLTLRERADVETKSVGEGQTRKVTIYPTRA